MSGEYIDDRNQAKYVRGDRGDDGVAFHARHCSTGGLAPPIILGVVP
jgi:hypothetical protein